MCQSAATTSALVVNELAITAIKYGALSDPKGTLDVLGPDEKLVLASTERGGLSVKALKNPRGHGSMLMTRATNQ